MRKLFGTTQYVEVGKDVISNEEFLQLEVLNMHQSNEAKKFYSNGLTYCVSICKKENNHDSYISNEAKEINLTVEEINQINKYLNI